MKKVFFSILMITLFLSSAYSMKVAGCYDYAIDAAHAEADYYGGYDYNEWEEAAYFYLEACRDAGGNIGSPVFM